MPTAPAQITRPARRSPNRRREVARLVFWNLMLAFAVVGLPILF